MRRVVSSASAGGGGGGGAHVCLLQETFKRSGRERNGTHTQPSSFAIYVNCSSSDKRWSMRFLSSL